MVIKLKDTFSSEFIFEDVDYDYSNKTLTSHKPTLNNAESLNREKTKIPDIFKAIDVPKPVQKELLKQNVLKKKSLSFLDLNLSRPLLKAIATLNYKKPTPIQSSAIPIALKGNDICACASTGTGKTAAFILPILERLMFKPKYALNMTRVLILVPTRELGLQVYQVTKDLSQFITSHTPDKDKLSSQDISLQFTNGISIALCVGGLDIKNQEAAIRRRPDIIIATPGRLIDHLQNAPSFDLQSVEILVLDEADRMLDEFFAQQMTEIISNCSAKRQTMLFSATMTEKVKDLARVSLNNPSKLFVDSNLSVPKNLRQEFVRIREQRESDREAILAALLARSFHYGVIVFVQTKLQTHRLSVQLNLLGLKVGELHGNLNQNERIESLKKFKEGQIGILICTDLASRGLDIEGVKTIINFTLPNSYQHYVHRVGRTARAGNKGRAISLVGDQERNVFREIIKNAVTFSLAATPNSKEEGKVLYRKIDPLVITDFKLKLEQLETKLQENLKDEKMNKDIRVAQLRVFKAEKLIEHREEIMSRPKRIWFQTHGERMRDQKSLRLDPTERKKRVAIKSNRSDDDEVNAKPTNNKKKWGKNKLEKIKAKDMSTEERINHEITKAKQYALKCLELSDVSRNDNKGHRSTNDKSTKGTKRKSFTKQLTDTDKKRKYILKNENEGFKNKRNRNNVTRKK
ncbi:unnamed protein product [Gordionus sp. m RMFG-2023]|uniref:probable ATP-dependent RNA helicase DDX27 n=1 Tax=Gordionus sp. m RMFG-2023 TaxID=3053472 RepID=UPI0030E4BC0D